MTHSLAYWSAYWITIISLFSLFTWGLVTVLTWVVNLLTELVLWLLLED